MPPPSCLPAKASSPSVLDLWIRSGWASTHPLRLQRGWDHWVLADSIAFCMSDSAVATGTPPSRAGCRSLRHCPTCRKLSSQLAPSDPSHAVAAVGGLRPTHCGSTSPEPRATKPSREGKKEGAWLLKLSRARRPRQSTPNLIGPSRTWVRIGGRRHKADGQRSSLPRALFCWP